LLAAISFATVVASGVGGLLIGAWYAEISAAAVAVKFPVTYGHEQQ
jgi:hypothetical protein